ncbi:MAG: hydrogenase iron-sulfur subunit [Thermoplasmata archaeon]|nr:hydrogenase iron-sulfur subunit [Thermoplasmata archaeon]TFG67361.1 MAG: hydrogenase iron-sulfur subunit [Methanomassiliicoccus sp.]
MTEKHHTTHHETHALEKKHDSEWEPKIIGFLCNWCSYAGADLCGVSRYQYPTNIRPVRVMCSTRISPHLVLDIFKAGADGILLGGCHIGDCHYISGNYYTEKRVNLMKKLLKECGIAPERLRLEWVSASEGEKFSKVVTEFTETVKALGPNKVKKDERLMSRVAAADMASETFRLKALVGKELNLVGKGNVYDNKLDPEEIEKIITEATSDEFERSLILELSRTKARSVKELGEMMEVPTDKVLRHIVLLRQNSLIAMEHPEGFTPTYKTIEIGGEQ